MKNIYLLFTSLALLMITSCSDEYSDNVKALVDPIYLNASTSSLNFESTAGSAQFDVQSLATAWDVSCNADWVACTPDHGEGASKVSVSVQANKTTGTRGATVRLGSTVQSALVRNITITQAAPQAFLNVSETSISFSGASGTKSVAVDCNNAWTYELAIASSWLTVDKTSTGLMLKVAENTTGAARQAYVIVQSGGLSQRIDVVQSAANSSVSTTSLSFSYDSGSQTFTIDSETSWEARVSSNAGWVKLDKYTGEAGKHTVTVSVTKNTSKDARIGYITVAGKEITVYQEGVRLSVSADEIEFLETGETKILTLSSNTSWKAQLTYRGDADNWLTIIPTEGTGNATVVLIASSNMKSTRIATLQFVSTDGLISSEKINIFQNGSGISTVSLPKFGSEGAVYTYEQLLPQQWTANVESGISWLHISPKGGSGSTPVVITVDKNTAVADRDSYIDITYANGQIFRVLISQAGIGISVSTQSYQFYAMGGSSEPITVEATGAVDVTSSQSWLKASLTGNVLILTATDNTTGSARQADVTLSLSGKSAHSVIKVTQASQSGSFIVNGYDADEDLLAYTHQHNGHEFVDLGLSVKWATCNLGAETAEQYGDYYAWGETTTKSSYQWSNYRWCNGTATSLTKYNDNTAFGTVDNKYRLDINDDAAHTAWGGNWRMPTREEFYELSTRCTHQFTTRGGISGMLITGPNGRTIFLPSAGCHTASGVDGRTTEGWYWTSDEATVCHTSSSVTLFNYILNWTRANGCNIRPVCP